jgi:hypothetical protein
VATTWLYARHLFNVHFRTFPEDAGPCTAISSNFERGLCSASQIFSRCVILESAMKRSVHKLILVGMAFAMLGFGCLRGVSDVSNNGEIDRGAILSEARKSGLIMNEDEILIMTQSAVYDVVNLATNETRQTFRENNFSSWRSAALADVTGGGSFGLAHTFSSKDRFRLFARMGGLRILDDQHAYEGWIVRRGESLRAVSLGYAELVGEWYEIALESTENLSDHDFFVLTLEVLDDEPAPSEHILEGAFQ